MHPLLRIQTNKFAWLFNPLVIIVLFFGVAGATVSQAAQVSDVTAGPTTPSPILFVTQLPFPSDFTTINAVFGNHKADMQSAPRGGDLWIRYPDGTLKNLTAGAGYGINGLQGATAIAVRDPAMYWDGTKAIFSMVIGAPTQQYQVKTFFWQMYEITGLGQNQTPIITKVPNQPVTFNNVSPIYGTDDRIIFTSDRPRNGATQLYPQRDEYEEAPTVTGLWSLNVATGDLKMLNHAPSGDFTPTIDSFGRLIFTQWDHLQRDQQADTDVLKGNTYGTFNYADESANAARLNDRTEIFPEPRTARTDLLAGTNLVGHEFNQFFPWQITEDGTEQEILNHLGRHELRGYIPAAIKGDPNVFDYYGQLSRFNPNSITNMLQVKEDSTHPGRYYGVDAPEFGTHASGQIIYLNAPPTTDADHIAVTYFTHRETSNITNNPTANHSGFYRDPLPLSDGSMIAAHTSTTKQDQNTGTTANPASLYAFRLQTLVIGGNGYWTAGQFLTNGITKTISYWNPDVMVSYTGPLWELQLVEVRARTRPARLTPSLPVPEQQVFAQAGVELTQLQAYLTQNNLALIVSRNVTTRDDFDKQQPFNLRVPGGVQTIGAGGKIYDVAHLQLFQADQIRGLSFGSNTPVAGRRVLAQLLHDPAAVAANPANPGGPASSVAIATDGSMAAFVPARRAMTWQLTDPSGNAVVKERVWITFQPGEVRVCTSCHGLSSLDQAGHTAPTNQPQALLQLLQTWKANSSNSPTATNTPTPTNTPTATPVVNPENTPTSTPTNPPATGNVPQIAGCSVFPADNIWNTPIDTLPVDPNSPTYISTIGASTGLHPDFGAGLWNGGPIGIPFSVVPSSQPKVTIGFNPNGYANESDPGPYPVPTNAPIEGGAASTGDRHVLVVQEGNCNLYEIYKAVPQSDGSWEVYSSAKYDLNAQTLRPSTWTSADAAGLPILPGLVRYEEVAKGAINHAIRFTVPQTRRAFIWPARHYASNLTAAQYPPMGQRFRLKATYDISGFAPQVQVILRAMKKYGIILADNGSAWYISGAPDNRWNNDILHQLQQVTGSNFEAVDESSLMVDPNSGQARTNGAATPTPTVTLTKTPALTATPTKTLTPIATTTSGGIGGTVTTGANVAVSGIQVTAFRQNGSTWQAIGQINTDNTGRYLLNNLTPGVYRVRFDDIKLRYANQFYKNGATLSVATNVNVTPGNIIRDINALLVRSVAASTQVTGNISQWMDSTSGQLVITAWLGSQMTFTQTTSCGDSGATVQKVYLAVGAHTFPMEKATTDNNSYSKLLRIPDDLPPGEKYPIKVRWECATQVSAAASTLDATIGALQVSTSGPSGQITDATTGQPIKGAVITLYKVQVWRPRTGPVDNADGTCESIASKAANVAWSQPAPTDLGVWISTEVDETAAAAQINPTVNPQLTGSDGRYSWAVAEGCWYVTAEADGYVTAVSAVAGATPVLTGLNVALIPVSTLYLPIIRNP